MTQTKNNNKIVFFGSDENSARLLSELIFAKYNISLVVSKTEKKTGREKKENPVKKIAIQNHLAILEKDKLETADFEIIKNIQPTLGILLAFGSLISEKIIDIFPLGILNVHPSLLPLLRGPSPIQTALLNGDSETGVSLMLLSKKMDAGPIIAQEKISIQKNDNYISLSEKLFSIGNKLVISNLEKYINKEIEIQAQNETNATFSKIINKDDGLINWLDSAQNIHNKIRAFYLWPSAYTIFNDKLLKIKKASFENKKTSHNVGEVFLEENRISICCGNGILYPEILQIEGRSETDIKSFANGYQNFIGTKLS